MTSSYASSKLPSQLINTQTHRVSSYGGTGPLFFYRLNWLPRQKSVWVTCQPCSRKEVPVGSVGARTERRRVSPYNRKKRKRKEISPYGIFADPELAPNYQPRIKYLIFIEAIQPRRPKLKELILPDFQAEPLD